MRLRLAIIILSTLSLVALLTYNVAARNSDGENRPKLPRAAGSGEQTLTYRSQPGGENTLRASDLMNRRVYLPLVLNGFSEGGSAGPTPTPSATPIVPIPTSTSTPTATPQAVTPQSGSWSGTNDQGRNLSFSVGSSGATISQLTLSVGWSGACGVSSTTTYFYDIPINNGAFTSTQLQSVISGTFTTASNANGTYKAVLKIDYPYTCTATRTGTWTASHP